MTENVYAIYDDGIKSFGNPFHFSTDEEAIRTFNNLVNHETQTNVYRHPSDFHLYKIGTYERSVGKFTNPEPHEKIVSGISLKKPVADDSLEIKDIVNEVRDMVIDLIKKQR